MESLNETCFGTPFEEKYLLHIWQRWILVVLSICIILLIFLVNSLVIISMWKTNQLSNMSLRLLFLLSITDCFFGALAGIPFTIMMVAYYDQTYCHIELVDQFFMTLLGKTTSYLLVLIAIDRYARIKFLVEYPTMAVDKWFYVGTASVVFVALMQAIFNVITRISHSYPYTKMFVAFCDIFLLLVGSIAYLMAIVVARRHQRNAINQEILAKVQESFTYVAKLIIMTAICFYVPYEIMSLTREFTKDKMQGRLKQWFSFFMFITYMLPFCNSFANGIVFLLNNQKANNFVKKLLSRERRIFSFSDFPEHIVITY